MCAYVCVICMCFACLCSMCANIFVVYMFVLCVVNEHIANRYIIANTDQLTYDRIYTIEVIIDAFVNY